MNTVLVKLAVLSFPSSRDHAEPHKVQRMGAFDWARYHPIIVERDGLNLIIIDGMTRVEAARRAGITELPAYVFPVSGA